MRISCLISVPWALALYCMAPASAYTSRGWVYAHPPREYPEEDYFYGSKPVQLPYYGAPARYEPEVYGRIPYPYYYDPYAHYAEEDPERQDERLAALPVGQETWYESEEPRWKPEDLDDVNAAFLDNLILTQMAQDAQRRRENARASVDYEDRESEDEDVRELKALAGKPLYHVPKTVPRHDDEDYPNDDAFINWNGNKRSVVVTEAPTTRKPRPGQDEVAVPQPQPINQHHQHQPAQQDKKDTLYQTIAHMLAAEKTHTHKQESAEKPRRLDKRFVAGDRDLVAELRGLKHRIAT